MFIVYMFRSRLRVSKTKRHLLFSDKGEYAVSVDLDPDLITEDLLNYLTTETDHLLSRPESRHTARNQS